MLPILLEADTNSDLILSPWELDAFYAERSIPSGRIQYYGQFGDIKHVALKDSGLGSDCSATSKLGQEILMSHEIEELSFGMYGEMQGGY
jgi:hypothetical protein